MSGLHHITAIAGNAARNLAFYTETLGLRLVKKTVNFDDPSTYHLYFGDETGSPGTILTFFPWEHAAAGRLGVGQTEQIAFRVPASSLGWWTQRLIERGVTHEAPEKRFGETVLAFSDPDGTRLALVGVPDVDLEPAWKDGGVSSDHAIRGVHGVTLLLESGDTTGAILEGVFGFIKAGQEGAITRYQAPNVKIGANVDLHSVGQFLRGRPGRGSVHHIAFRAKDDADEEAMARKAADLFGLATTEQKDRNYFRSIYFREPGGVLFEIATDAPGFAVDEPAETLGQALKLPHQFEQHRAEIEAALPQLEPASTRAA